MNICVLRDGCKQVGLSAEGARLVRLGSNAVFRLTGSVVVRIARPEGTAGACRAVAVARWLEAEDYPAARLLPFDQPIMVNGHAVTFWEAVSPVGNEWGSTPQLAALLVRLHELDPPLNLRLPTLAPFTAAAARIASSAWLSDSDRHLLTGRLTDLRQRFEGIDWQLTSGIIHGDASVGNVLRDPVGSPVLIDLDSFSIGHREWDLVLTATYFERLGWHTRAEYAEFATVYGWDIMSWPGYPTLRELCEFLMITWAVAQADGSERASAEAAKRIASLRSGRKRQDWDPL
jgi:aminoglycoside phosphotransferase (APT) family kinase protein